MNATRNLALILFLVISSTRVLPQPPPGHDREPPNHPPPMFGEEGPRGDPAFRPAAPLHRWMQELRKNDPEQFQRLQELRINDPEEFRAVTREMLKNQGLQKLREERPAVYDAMMALPDEDRSWLIERFLRPLALAPDKPPMKEVGPRGHDLNIDRNLIRTYHESGSEEEKNRIREELRQQLSEAYDRQLELRGRQLAEAEAKLSAIRSAIAEGEEGKNEFIDKKLSAWLNNPPPRMKHSD